MLFAAGIWLFYVLDETIETKINLPLSYINTPEKKVAVNELPQFLTTTFSGQGWFLLRNRLSLKENIVEIDLKNDLFEEQVNENNLLNIINKQTPQSIKAVSCEPKEILFQFEESIEKKIPLIIPKVLSFLQNYDIKGEIKITPDSIVAKGPVSIIDTLKNWSTDTIKHIDLNKPIEGKISLKETLANIVFSEYLLDYKIDVAQYTEKKLTVAVKVINNQNENLLIVPKKVELKCLVPISEYDKITVDDFSVLADYKKERIKGYINLKINKKSNFAKKINFFPKSVEYIKLNE